MHKIVHINIIFCIASFETTTNDDYNDLDGVPRIVEYVSGISSDNQRK